MVTWRPEDPAGHMPYCVHPEAHSPARFCAADLGEPETMQGKPSRAWHRDHPTVVRFGVITEVPPDGDSGNLALVHDLYRVVGRRGFEEEVEGIFSLDLRRTVFHVGEVLILDSDGREIPYPGRKPSKWPVTCEEFADLEAALARAREVAGG